MNFLQKIARNTTPTGNVLEEAEAIGSVSLDTFLGAHRASITIGEYGNARLEIWGTGSTSSAALREAIAKVHALLPTLNVDP